jgi:hypothetical protein
MTLLRCAWTTPRSTIGERPHTAPCFKCMNGSRAVAVANCRASQPPSGRDLPLLAFGSSGVQGTSSRCPRARGDAMRPPLMRMTTKRAWSIAGPCPRRSAHNPIGPCPRSPASRRSIRGPIKAVLALRERCRSCRLRRRCHGQIPGSEGTDRPLRESRSARGSVIRPGSGTAIGTA